MIGPLDFCVESVTVANSKSMKKDFDAISRAVSKSRGLDGSSKHNSSAPIFESTSETSCFVVVARGKNSVVVAFALYRHSALSNSYFIEELLVDPSENIHALTLELIEKVRLHIAQHADLSAGGESHALVYVESDNPFSSKAAVGIVVAEAQLQALGDSGFKVIDFPYLTSVSSDSFGHESRLLLVAAADSTPLPNLLANEVLIKTLNDLPVHSIDPEGVAGLDAPNGNVKFLSRRKHTNLIGVRNYLSSEQPPLLNCVEVKDSESKEFQEFIGVYLRTFGGEPCAIDIDVFVDRLSKKIPGVHHHLWVISGPSGDPEGMASFFSLPSAGFIEYFSVEGSLKGRGLYRWAMTRLERQLHLDNSSARGYYVEAGSHKHLITGVRVGFTKVPIDYLLPAVHGLERVPNHLCYKPYGRTYTAGVPGSHEILLAIDEILRYVYGVCDDDREEAISRYAIELSLAGPIIDLREIGSSGRKRDFANAKLSGSSS